MPRILVVEDDASSRNLIVRMLQHLGYATAEAENGLAALDLLAHDSQFDLIVSDVRMSPLDGLNLLSEAKHRYPNIPVLLTSVHGRPEWIHHAHEHGASGFLLKPFVKNQLAEMVESILAAVER